MKGGEGPSGKAAEREESQSHFFNCQFYMCKSPTAEPHRGTSGPREQLVSEGRS